MMTDAAPLPAPWHRWAEHVLGETVQAVDSSWPGERSQVWRLALLDGAPPVYLKAHRRPRMYARELVAYRDFVGQLEPTRAPRLLEADPQRCLLLLTAVAGECAARLALPAQEGSALHFQAGQLLARVHSAAVPGVAARAAADSYRRTVAKIDGHLRRAGDLLAEDERLHVRAAGAILADLGALPVAYTHGDWTPRNFLWDRPTARLAVIDFERAEHAPAVRDIVRLATSTWTGRMDLREAFFAGYGRPLTAAEARALPALAALDSLSGIVYDAEHHDPELAVRGHRTLAQLIRNGDLDG